MSNASSHTEGHLIENFVERDRLSVQLSQIGALLPPALQDRYRRIVFRLLDSTSVVDIVSEAKRVASNLFQQEIEEAEALSTPRGIYRRPPHSSASIQKIHRYRNRRS